MKIKLKKCGTAGSTVTWNEMRRGDLAEHPAYGIILKTSEQWAFRFDTGYSIESGNLYGEMRPVVGQLNWRYR